MPKPAVIVVNSHVAVGSVGGRASVFVLERLGFPVWFVPTVQLTWHPGHGPSARLVTRAEAFAGFLDDLARAPGLDAVAAVLSGYLGDGRQADAIARLVGAVKRASPGALYLCDPNIGDDRRLFHPPSVTEAIGERLLPLADVTTPNRHELVRLCARPAGDNEALTALARGLAAGEVVVTSAFAPSGQIGNLVVAGDDVHLAAHPRLEKAPHGTGDLFAALYLAERLGGRSPAEAADRTAAAVLAAVKLASDMGVDEIPLVAAQSFFQNLTRPEGS